MKHLLIPLHCLLMLLLAFSSHLAYAQSEEHSHITNAVIDYFATPRENIHLQPIKTLFFTNEDISFAGQIISRQKNTLSSSTNNIFVSLIDASGKSIDSRLFFAEGGRFAGRLQPNASYKTGVYYLRAYTNWMNNFKEDESTLVKIYLVNELNNTVPLFASADPATLRLELYPEGGTQVVSVKNSIAIAVKDCHGNAFEISEGEIHNSKGEFVRIFSTNSDGYGKFTYTPSTAQNFRLKFRTGGKSYEFPVPDPQLTGVAIELDNDSPDVVNITLRTNKESVALFGGKLLTMLIQKDNRAHFFDILFTDTQLSHEIAVSKEFMFSGTNTLRLLDPQLNQIAERVFYRMPESETTPKLRVISRGDSLVVAIQQLPARTSFTVLVTPASSLVTHGMPSIKTSMAIDPYLSRGLEHPVNISSDIRNTAKSLDLQLLHHKSKYSWADIMAGPPTISHTFDKGLSIAGELFHAPKKIKDYVVRLFSLRSGVNETAEINEKNEVAFNNLILADSSWVNLTLVRKDNGIPVKFDGNWRVLNSDRKLFPARFAARDCLVPGSGDPLPEFVHLEGELLENVKIQALEKPLFNHKHKPVNQHLNAHKIVAGNNSSTVLDFIADNGFNVNRQRTYKMIGVQIVGRSITTINAMPSIPLIFLDDVKLVTNDELWHLKMADIDEIYINSSAIVNSLDMNIGIIRIYRKKPSLVGAKQDSNAQPLQIKGGFQRLSNNRKTTYRQDSDAARYGVTAWYPALMTDDQGTVELTIPVHEEPGIIRLGGIDHAGNYVCYIAELPTLKEE